MADINSQEENDFVWKDIGERVKDLDFGTSLDVTGTPIFGGVELINTCHFTCF